MTVDLRPEDELLIQRRLESGSFSTPEEVIHQALESLEAEQRWIEESRRKIQLGLEQLDRGERITPEECLAHLEARQAEWRAARLR